MGLVMVDRIRKMQVQCFSVASGRKAASSTTAGRVEARAAGRLPKRLAGSRRTACVLMLLLGLGGCGQKGALYLPVSLAPAASASAAPLSSERPPARSDSARTP